MEKAVRLAAEKLVNLAVQDTGQGRRAANFLLAWWNAEQHGGFDFTDLTNVDREIAEAMATIVVFLAQSSDYYYPTEYRHEIEQIITRRQPVAAAFPGRIISGVK